MTKEEAPASPKDAALKLALEAFEYQAALTRDDSTNEWNYSFKMQDIAVAAIKEALAQPQRQWAGLTDDEVYKIAFALEGEHWKKVADAIEAKLKEKNT